MTPLDKWWPCLADSERGIAFFDLRPASEENIRIEADPITEPRWDRVLPILEEEQVFMCRMMAPLLLKRKGLRVLDIGTGSGVFAICAAKLGCSVTAVDISPRALRFARHNARLNGVRVSTGDQEPLPREISFQHRTFRELDEAGLFDVVILAPPYNPTCPGVLPALHASAGELGQDCFLEQLPIAAKHLHLGGVCIGNQMILADISGNLLWQSELERAFPGGSACFKRVIREDRPVKAFLRSQYSTFLDNKQTLSPSVGEVDGYIERQSADHQFALVYYEITRTTGTPEPTGSVPLQIKELADGAGPSQGWRERELLHRRIIEHTAQEHSFPAPALFLEVDALPDFPVRAASDPQGSWRTSCLSYIDSWFAKTRLLHPEAGLFNLVLVDTAPWYPSRATRTSLPQECAIWVNSKANLVAGNGDSDAPLETALLEYQKNTIRQQKARVGPFLHPVFTGSQTPYEWRPVHFSTLGEQEIVTPPDNNLSWQRAVKIAEQVAAAALTDEEHQRLESIGTRVLSESSKAFGVRLAHVSSNLEQLEVPAGDIASFKENLARRIESIHTSSTDADRVLTDFNDCHLSMHLRLRIVFNTRSNGAADCVTHLIGLPVSIASTDSVHETRTLPESYRGGVWVYVEASSWSPVHERYLLDLIRVLSMLYEDKYTKMSAAELRLSSTDASRFNWSHETKHIIVALRNWPCRLAANAAKLPFGLGTASSEVPSDLALLPFASLFDAGMAHLEAWTMAPSPSDLPFSGEDSSLWPKDFTTLALAAMKAAQDAFLIRLFRKFPVNDSSFAQLDRFLREIREAMPSLHIEGVSSNSVAVDLNSKFWQDFARLLLCEFREMLQHGLWDAGSSVFITHENGLVQNAIFQNKRAGEHWNQNIRNLALPDVEYFSLAKVYDAFKKPLFFACSTGDGDRVRKNLAQSIGATMRFPVVNRDLFAVEYIFQLETA